MSNLTWKSADHINLVISILLLFVASSVIAQSRKLKRNEGYLGLHFDFHASLSDSIGTRFSGEMIDSMLTITKPDYIQVDCKGHPGISSYPTKVGIPASYFEKDIMKVWRDVTNKHKIPLVVHFSGVIDEEAVRRHPEWAMRDSEGVVDTKNTTTTGRYVDDSLIPQLKELIDRYQIDGAWVDGDCWALRPDYSPSMKRAYEQTGRVVPKSSTDTGYADYIEFNRDKFKAYVSHYVESLHSYRPGFQITSNWIYSSFMPEKPSLNVDFLSGDLAPFNSVYSAAFQARCLALQGKPWDLMAWSFSLNWRDGKHGLQSAKSISQLQQEAAQVIAMGGGYQSYWTQNRDGSLRPYTFRQMAKINDFVRARQSFCHHNQVIPQVGIIYSTQGWKKKTKAIYSSSGSEAVSGILNMVLDAQYSSEILMDHHLEGRIDQYPLLIVPEWEYIDQALKQKLLSYAERGGKLLVIGGSCVNNFKDVLQVDFIGMPLERDLNLGFNNEMSGVWGKFQEIKVKPGTQTVGTLSAQKDFRFPSYPFASINNYGKGKIAGVYIDLAYSYSSAQSMLHKRALRQMVNLLFPNPMVKVSGSDYVHIVTTRKENKVYLHLINTGGSHSNENVFVYDEVPPLINLSVSIATAKKPTNIILQPDNVKLPFSYNDGLVTVLLDKVMIHQILQLE